MPCLVDPLPYHVKWLKFLTLTFAQGHKCREIEHEAHEANEGVERWGLGQKWENLRLHEDSSS